MLHMVSSHILWPLLGVSKKSCQVFLLDFMNNMSVNNVYMKYIFIYPVTMKTFGILLDQAEFGLISFILNKIT